MTREKASGQKQTSGLPAAGPEKNETTSALSTGSSGGARKSIRSGNKANRPQIGGTAVPGAKSTQPKVISNTNNPQQQEKENSNRMMRRRMEQLGTGPQAPEQVKTVQDRRKKRIAHIRERQKAEVSAVKRSLPGGKLVTDTSRVYYLIGGVAGAIVLLILVFVVLRVTGVLH